MRAGLAAKRGSDRRLIESGHLASRTPPPNTTTKTSGSANPHSGRLHFDASLAQKGIATAGIEKLWGFAGNIAAVRPDILDKLNPDQTIDEYASALGVSPKIIVSDEDVAKGRQAKQQEAAMATAAGAAGAAVQGAKTLSETEVGGGANALQLMLGAGGGSGTA